MQYTRARTHPPQVKRKRAQCPDVCAALFLKPYGMLPS